MSNRRWSILSLVAVALVAGCSGGPTSSAVNPGSSDQWAFQSTVLRNREALFEARAYTQAPGSVEVDTQFTVGIRVCGPQMSCESGTPRPVPSAGGPSAGPSAVPSGAASSTPSASASSGGGVVAAGAIIKVSLTSDHDVTVVTEPTESQPVIDVTDVATWLWRVKAAEPGTYTFDFHVLTLAEDTNVPLVPETVFSQKVSVASTTRRDVSHFGSSFVNFITTAGGVITAVAAIAGAITATVRWRRRRAAPDA